MPDPRAGHTSCQVYWSTSAVTVDRSWVTDDDVRGIARYRDAADRNRSLIGAALLRLALARHLGAYDVRVTRRCDTCGGPHGKPTIGDNAAHVSVTHSGDRVAVAIANAPVGIDVEHAVETWDVATVAAAIQHPGDVPLDRDGFWRTWVRKEAVVKATGEGLVRDLRDVVVSSPTSAARLVRYPGIVASGVVVRDIDLGEGYPAALALLTRSTAHLSVEEVVGRVGI
jgi:4'-phosphopantetheinyl transferase